MAPQYDASIEASIARVKRGRASWPIEGLTRRLGVERAPFNELSISGPFGAAFGAAPVDPNLGPPPTSRAAILRSRAIRSALPLVVGFDLKFKLCGLLCPVRMGPLEAGLALSSEIFLLLSASSVSW